MNILVPVPVCRQFRPGDPSVMVLSMKFVTLCRPGNTLIGPHAWGRDEGFKIFICLKSQECVIIGVGMVLISWRRSRWKIRLPIFVSWRTCILYYMESLITTLWFVEHNSFRLLILFLFDSAFCGHMIMI